MQPNVEDYQEKIEYLIEMVPTMRRYINAQRLETLMGAVSQELNGRHLMLDMLCDIANRIDGLAPAMSTDGKPPEKVQATLHYYTDDTEFFLTEAPDADDPDVAYGLLVTPSQVEMGFVALSDVTKDHVEIDMFYSPESLSAILSKHDIPQPGKKNESIVIPIRRTNAPT